MRVFIIVLNSFVTFICLLTTIYLVKTTFSRSFKYTLDLVLVGLSPYFWATMGIVLCLGPSILGSSIGIYTIGSSILGAGVLAPHIKTRNLISIIFCEVVAIYGLIMSIILSGFTEDFSWQILIRTSKPAGWFSSYLMFGTGVIVGYVNLICGISIGVVGSGTALSDAATPSSFMKLLVLEIFASCLGIYGLICGIFVMSKVALK